MPRLHEHSLLDAESSAEMGIADMDSDEIDDQNDNVRTSSEMRRHTRRRHKPKTTTSASTKKRTKVTKRPKSTTTEQASPFFDPVDNVENMLGLEEVQFDVSCLPFR